jgi:hypothetical protein
VLRERDVPGGANIGLIDTVARYALDHGFHVIIDGILRADAYAAMLDGLHRDHQGLSRFYYLDVPFEETMRRHQTRPQAAEFGRAEMSCWYRGRDLLPGGIEQVIPDANSLQATVRLVMDEAGLAGQPCEPTVGTSSSTRYAAIRLRSASASAPESGGAKIPQVSRRSGLLPPGVVQLTTVDRVGAEIVDKAKHRCFGALRITGDREGFPSRHSSQNSLLEKARGEDVVERLDHGTADLLRDPRAVEHAAVDRMDAAVAELRVVVAGIDHDDAARHVRKRPRGRSATAFVGMATMTISAAWAASTTETGVAPIRVASAARLSAPLEFAIETWWPSLARRCARVPPTAPAPMTPIFIQTLLSNQRCVPGWAMDWLRSRLSHLGGLPVIVRVTVGSARTPGRWPPANSIGHPRRRCQR